jgi:nicotinamidase-related amidase
MTALSSPKAPKHDAKRGGVALLIIDVINRFDFEGGDILKAKTERLIEPIEKLRSTFDRLRAPVIYVNDNFQEWHSEKSKLVERAAKWAPELIGRLRPRARDYFVIKPQFSGFYSTNLPLLLPKLGVSRLVLAGIATDICVLFTAADAHMRDYALWVPNDVVASENDERGQWALDIMRHQLGAKIGQTCDLDLRTWRSRLDAEGIA